MLNITTTTPTDSTLSQRDRLLASPAHSPWTPERIEQLRNCVTSGLSCSQIAAEIGVTRNAVIGKIHRLGLSPGRPAAPARSCPPRARPPRSSPQRQFLRLMFAQAPGLAGDEADPRRSRACSAARCSNWRRANAVGRRRSVRGGFRLLRQPSRRGLLLLRRPRADGLSRSGAAARLAETSFRCGRHARADRGHGACRAPSAALHRRFRRGLTAAHLAPRRIAMRAVPRAGPSSRLPSPSQWPAWPLPRRPPARSR